MHSKEMAVKVKSGLDPLFWFDYMVVSVVMNCVGVLMILVGLAYFRVFRGKRLSL